MTDQRFKSVAVLTGAGISAESGVPTFRGEDGLWRQYRAEDLATPQAFEREPTVVWEWYDWRRRLIAGCEPNAAHRVLVQMERSCEDFTLITQNVDDLHQRAGCTASRQYMADAMYVRRNRQRQSRGTAPPASAPMSMRSSPTASCSLVWGDTGPCRAQCGLRSG